VIALRNSSLTAIEALGCIAVQLSSIPKLWTDELYYIAMTPVIWLENGHIELTPE
jgi:hypothetical protein